LHQFVTYGALDMVDMLFPHSSTSYLKAVDAYGRWFVSAYVTPSNVRFLLFHDQKGEDSIKSFFLDCFDSYTKAISNPFYEPWKKLSGVKNLEDSIRKAYKKHLQ
jgi:trafficking protein particle complex subunit 2